MDIDLVYRRLEELIKEVLVYQRLEDLIKEVLVWSTENYSTQNLINTEVEIELTSKGNVALLLISMSHLQISMSYIPGLYIFLPNNKLMLPVKNKEGVRWIADNVPLDNRRYLDFLKHNFIKEISNGNVTVIGENIKRVLVKLKIETAIDWLNYTASAGHRFL